MYSASSRRSAHTSRWTISGTGYSSLGYFRQFPFDKVKIDQTFVRDLAESHEAMAIVRSIIALGKGLRMMVVAEGVETLDQMELLLSEGCQQLQGYLVGRPDGIRRSLRSCESERSTPIRATVCVTNVWNACDHLRAFGVPPATS